MPAGLRVTTSSGILQIDELYRNASLAAKLPITLFHRGSWDSTYGPDDWVGSINTGAYFPCLLAFAPVNYPNAATLSGVYPTFDTGALDDYALNLRSGTEQIDCFLYRDQALSSGAGQGLQVFDAAGVCVFDSALEYLRVVDSITHNLSDSWTRTFTPGRRYAVLVNKLGFKFYLSYVLGLYRVNVVLPLYNFSDTHIIECTPGVFTPVQDQFFSPPAITLPPEQTVQTLILDVTGY